MMLMKSVRSCALYSSEHSDAEDDGGVEETAAGGGQTRNKETDELQHPATESLSPEIL